jgi:hypothetical protein
MFSAISAIATLTVSGNASRSSAVVFGAFFW